MIVICTSRSPVCLHPFTLSSSERLAEAGFPFRQKNIKVSFFSFSRLSDLSRCMGQSSLNVSPCALVSRVAFHCRAPVYRESPTDPRTLRPLSEGRCPARVAGFGDVPYSPRAHSWNSIFATDSGSPGCHPRQSLSTGCSHREGRLDSLLLRSRKDHRGHTAHQHRVFGESSLCIFSGGTKLTFLDIGVGKRRSAEGVRRNSQARCLYLASFIFLSVDALSLSEGN